jgi:hypothetical protein
MDRFNLKKWNEVEGKEKYCVKVSNKFAALEDLEAEGAEVHILVHWKVRLKWPKYTCICSQAFKCC